MQKHFRKMFPVFEIIAFNPLDGISLIITVLPHSPKISYMTKRDVFQLNFSNIYRKLQKRCCSLGFSSAWDTQTR